MLSDQRSGSGFRATKCHDFPRQNPGKKSCKCQGTLRDISLNSRAQSFLSLDFEIDTCGHVWYDPRTNPLDFEENSSKYNYAVKLRTIAPPRNIWSRFTTKKYDRFAESTTHIVYDFHEEQKRLEEGLDILEKEKVKVQEEIHIERGVRGVFDVEELVDLLREDNAQDIAVIQIPDRMNYVEHMVIASCKSKRHMSSMAEIVRRIYKKKKHTSDRSCIMEGKNTGWVALDMGNIALHLMDPELREDYDLETLWTVGAEFDDQCQKEKESDPLDLINFDIRQGARVLEMPTSAEISPNSSSV
ncbi:uncharacterized protein [Palaemon carinicauda]|uniref:uncharacterized protein n=1 Tax=Palaemon carinicauda TaxID=392227 RepID=UPI0035B58A72